MKQSLELSVLLVIIALNLFACGGSSLNNPISYEEGCASVKSAISEKCTENLEAFDCSKMTACGEDASDLEENDVKECVANIQKADNCSEASAVVCAIACQ